MSRFYSKKMSIHLSKKNGFLKKLYIGGKFSCIIINMNKLANYLLSKYNKEFKHVK